MTDHSRQKVLVVDSERDARRALACGLDEAGFVTAESATAEDARSRLSGFAYDALVVDIRLPDGDGLDLVDQALALHPNMRCVVMTSCGSIHQAVKALKRGASDYLIKPTLAVQVAEAIGVAATARPARTYAPIVVRSRDDRGARDDQGFRPAGMVGSSPVMFRLYSMLERVAPLTSTVLIQGETGTGKELVARTLHDNSPRRDHPFVAFNAAAIPDGLAEAELFGHVKGAFTGAVQARAGRFELADQGTLFIDEVSSMSPSLQAKLLRAVQEREVERVGTSRPVKVNTRIIAASNVDLREMVRAGTFREDLFYRLNVIAVSLPPLRERRQDIPALARHFVEVACRENRLAPKTLDQAALDLLMQFPWPGNVRHLQNAIEYAVAMSGRDPVIDPGALPDEIRQPGETAQPAASVVAMPATPDEGINFASTMSEIERELLLRYLDKAGGNKRRAARLLNMSRTTLIDKLNRMHIGSNGFAGSDHPALRVEEAVFRPEELTPGSDEREAVRAIA